MLNEIYNDDLHLDAYIYSTNAAATNGSTNDD